MALDLLCLSVPYTWLFIVLIFRFKPEDFITYDLKKLKQPWAVPPAMHYLESWIPSSEISMFLDFDLRSGFKVNVQPATHGTQVQYSLLELGRQCIQLKWHFKCIFKTINAWFAFHRSKYSRRVFAPDIM